MELRRLAEAATRTYVGQNWPSVRRLNYDGKDVLLADKRSDHNATNRYIAAASPDRILALLTDLDAAVSARQEAESRLAELPLLDEETLADVLASHRLANGFIAPPLIEDSGNRHRLMDPFEFARDIIHTVTLARTREPAGETE